MELRFFFLGRFRPYAHATVRLGNEAVEEKGAERHQLREQTHENKREGEGKRELAATGGSPPRWSLFHGHALAERLPQSTTEDIQ